MAKTNAKIHSINLINLELVKNDMLKEHFCLEEEITNEKCIDFIMSKDINYKIQKLINNNINDTDLYFYHYGYSITSAISRFSKDFVKTGENVFDYETTVQSSILFLVIKNRIYAIPTGQGFRLIDSYIIDKFGLVALSAMNSEFKVTALNSNSMSGKTHSENKVFRQELNFFDVQDVDSIIKELKGKINNKDTICSLLNLPNTTKRNKLGVVAKDSLQLTSSLKIDELIKTLKKIDELVTEDRVNNFIDIKILDRNKNSKEIDYNNQEVYKKLLETIENENSTYLGYDFFNKDVETFLDYNKYVIKFSDTISEDFEDPYDILSALKKLYLSLDLKNKTKEEKFKFVSQVEIFGINDDENIAYFGKLIENLSGEVECNGKHYFIWYGTYYFVEDSYFNRLNILLNKKLSIATYDNSLLKWINGDEDKYNSDLANSLNASLIHKCIPDNIEFADVLSFSGNECCIYHVKDNFNCSMRELDRQVELSMKKLNDLSLGNDKYFYDLYERSQNQKQRDDKNELHKHFKNVEDFISTMKSISKFKYKIVINIKDKNSIINSASNIAKYCFNHILSLSTEFNYELEICFISPN